jgi:AcrR family transcriptional regulator
MTDVAAHPERVRPLRRDAELNRLRILEAAAEVFAERGLEASLDDVAHRAGVGVGTVYRRFANKEALVDALFEARMDEVAEVARAAMAVPDSWQALVYFFEKVAEIIVRDHGIRDLMASTSYGQHRVAESRDRMLPIAEQIMARAKADGHLRPDFDQSDGQVLFFMLGEAADYCHPARPDIWRRYLTYLIDALHARRDAPTPLPAPPLTLDEADTIMQSWRPPRR